MWRYQRARWFMDAHSPRKPLQHGHGPRSPPNASRPLSASTSSWLDKRDWRQRKKSRGETSREKGWLQKVICTGATHGEKEAAGSGSNSVPAPPGDSGGYLWPHHCSRSLWRYYHADQRTGDG